jgi:4'-phosphopantetheinyl transferase EntD
VTAVRGSQPRSDADPAAPARAAELSPAIAALFPPGVVAAQLQGDVLGALEDRPDAATAADALALSRARGLLADAEWRSIAHCSAPRIRDFTAGRLCARRALQVLGIEGFSLLSAPDRQVLWPPHISGSITHTDGYAAAAIGRLAEVGSLGLDCERIEEVAQPLWREICTPAELEQFVHWAAPDRQRAATLCFVAKEAFYKAQFALFAELLQFDAVRIDLSEALRPEGAFRVHALRTLRVQGAAGGQAPSLAWTGRFRCHAGYVSAGVALPARIE